MSEKSRARAAQALTGDKYQTCLNWMRDNHEKVNIRMLVMKGSGKSGTEEAALYYQEEKEKGRTL